MIVGIVSAIAPTPTGKHGTWYNVKSLFGQTLLGGSIRGTTFIVGQQVSIISCGLHPILEYSFIESNYDTAYLVPDSAMDQAIAWSPASVALSAFAYLAGNKQLRYRPGRVTQVNSNALMVVDRWTNRLLPLPVQAPLTASQFKVDDIVLIQSKPLPFDQVIGWWEPSEIVSRENLLMVLWPTINDWYGTLPDKYAKYDLNTGLVKIQNFDYSKNYLVTGAGIINRLYYTGTEMMLLAQTNYQDWYGGWIGTTYFNWLKFGATEAKAEQAFIASGSSFMINYSGDYMRNTWTYPEGIQICSNGYQFYFLQVGGRFDNDGSATVWFRIQSQIGHASASFTVDASVYPVGPMHAPIFRFSSDPNTKKVYVWAIPLDGANKTYQVFEFDQFCRHIQSEITDFDHNWRPEVITATGKMLVGKYGLNYGCFTRMGQGSIIDTWTGLSNIKATVQLPIPYNCLLMETTYNNSQTLLKVALNPNWMFGTSGASFQMSAFPSKLTTAQLNEGWSFERAVAGIISEPRY